MVALSIGMEKSEAGGDRFWSPLPPLTLLNLGTPLVESVEHYALRLTATTGIAMRPLISLPPPYDEPGRRQIRLTSSFCGPGKIYRRRIDNLERLTGVTTIHCGSFLVLDSLLAPGAIGRKGGRRRWCPVCYLEWDESTSCECLQWSIDLRVTCPIHRCDLEDECRNCRSTQSTTTPYDRRRHCASCGIHLGAPGRFSPKATYVSWVEAQLTDIATLCANPEQKPFPADTFQTFVVEFLRSHQGECRRSAYTFQPISQLTRLNNPRAGGKVALHTLINICALQGISVRDLLLRPKEAACTPLRGGLGGYHPLERSMDVNVDRPKIMQLCLAAILSDVNLRYIPQPARVAREIDVDSPHSLSSRSRLYREYLLAYRKQGTRKTLIKMDSDFASALDSMKVLRPNPFGSYDGKASRYAVARATGVSLDEARGLVGSVTRFRRIVELTKAEVLGLTSAEVRAHKKLGSLQNWA